MKCYPWFLVVGFFVVFCSFLSCTNEQSSITSDQARQTMNDFFKALSTADTLLMERVTVDDFILYEHEEIWNRDSLLSLMSATQGRIWEIQDFELETRDDIAHVHYFNFSRKPEGRSWLESALLVRKEDQLQIQFMHSTKLYLNN